MEMAFVSGTAGGNATGRADSWGIGGREVKDVVEGVVKKIWKEVKGVELPEFRIMPYQVAMDVVSLLQARGRVNLW